MLQDQYFRAGTGCVIYNEIGQILSFLRTDTPNVWQLQQGGMDRGEKIEDTLWRELEEETALHKEDFSEVTAYPNCLYYEYPPHILKDFKPRGCRGQIHYWFFLKIKPDRVIDISAASDHEFSDYRWTSFKDLVASTTGPKVNVYQTLENFFTENILSK